MQRLKNGYVKSFITALLLVLISMPSVAFGYPQRGRGRNQDRWERFDRRDQKEWRKWDKQDRKEWRKRGKFINGHDARDGRWDGRGPQVRRIYTPRRWPRR